MRGQPSFSRSVQKKFYECKRYLIFKGAQMSFAEKIILFATLLITIALFLPWFAAQGSIAGNVLYNMNSANSFSALSGRSGYFIFPIIINMWISIVSIKRQEKIRYISPLRYDKLTINILGSILIICITLQCFFFLGGLQLFSQDIIYGPGIILSITGAFLALIGTYFLHKESHTGGKGSYSSEIRDEYSREKQKDERSNMSLPF